MDLGLRDRVALVTGASGGIGSATARLLAAEGADVAVAYGRRADAAERVAADVRAAGRRAWCVAVDVADAASVARAMSEIGDAVGGGLDVVVLNAGRNVVTPLDTLDPAEWDDVVRTNLGGTFHTLRAVRPLLRPGASVVTVASVAAQTGARQHAHYAAAKAGIVNLTKSVARDLAPDVRVNCVAPGLTRTAMGTATVADRGERDATKKLLAGRLAAPEEIARVIVFVASPAASFMYGATIDVNGGRELR
ncbi:MAG TPA: SDR family NAD(P)-dependent oxidoreductase [Gemmatimonadaceae bacterium]|jgi:3-oxoacyl-[acyl-carrier protein] reductase|nr:SDR family NAD(P)-dependent oxidoreductase [Gemmatimonadaceae bacterium]